MNSGKKQSNTTKNAIAAKYQSPGFCLPPTAIQTKPVNNENDQQDNRIGRDSSLNNYTDISDGLLWVQDKQKDGDELLNDHAGTSRTGVGYTHSTHGRTDDDVTDGHNPLPEADKLS